MSSCFLFCYVTIVWDHVSLCDFFPCIQHLWKLLVEESDLVGHLQVSSYEGSCLLPSSLKSGSLHESLPSNQGLYIQWTIYVGQASSYIAYIYFILADCQRLFLAGKRRAVPGLCWPCPAIHESPTGCNYSAWYVTMSEVQSEFLVYKWSNMYRLYPCPVGCKSCYILWEGSVIAKEEPKASLRHFRAIMKVLTFWCNGFYISLSRDTFNSSNLSMLCKQRYYGVDTY